MAVRYALYALNQEYGHGPQRRARGALHAGQHAGDRRLGLERRRRGAACGRAGRRGPDRRRRRQRAERAAAATTGFGVQFGGDAVPTVGKPLIDYITIANLYQPCAALAPAASMAEVSVYNYMVADGDDRPRDRDRCTALAAQRPRHRQRHRRAGGRCADKLRAYGWSAEHDTMHNAHYGLGNAPIVGDVPNAARPLFGGRQRVRHEPGAGRRRRRLVAISADDEGRRASRSPTAPPTACRRAWSTTTRSAGQVVGLRRLARPAARPTSRSTPRCASARW